MLDALRKCTDSGSFIKVVPLRRIILDLSGHPTFSEAVNQKCHMMQPEAITYITDLQLLSVQI